MRAAVRPDDVLAPVAKVGDHRHPLAPAMRLDALEPGQDRLAVEDLDVEVEDVRGRGVRPHPDQAAVGVDDQPAAATRPRERRVQEVVTASGGRRRTGRCQPPAAAGRAWSRRLVAVHDPGAVSDLPARQGLGRRLSATCIRASRPVPPARRPRLPACPNNCLRDTSRPIAFALPLAAHAVSENYVMKQAGVTLPPDIDRRRGLGLSAAQLGPIGGGIGELRARSADSAYSVSQLGRRSPSSA